MDLNFKYLGKIDIENIKKIFLDGPWKNSLSNKRRRIFKTHKYTQSIPLMFSLEGWKLPSHIRDEKTEFYDEFYDEVFFSELENILIEKLGEGYFVKIQFVKLDSRRFITPHKDGGNLIENHRVHIPIKSNPNVKFTICSEIEEGHFQEEIKVMKEGEIWEINNERLHSVTNNSSEDRIHLIVDWHKI